MRPDERDNAYLWDMLKFARAAQQIVRGITFEQYEQDVTKKLALERAIEVIGEAARGVSDVFEKAHPEIPWQLIVAQRHVIAHEYGEIKHDRLWRVVTEHIPKLVEQLEGILPKDKHP